MIDKVEQSAVCELHMKRKVMWEASIASHEKYIDPQTGLFAEKFVEHRACPVCGARDDSFLFNKCGGQYVMCNACSLIYINPVFRDDFLEEYYRNNHQFQGEIVAGDRSFYDALYQKGLATASRVLEVGNILDIGCSTGIFLDNALQCGWKTFGLELNKTEASIARAKGHDVQEETLQVASFEPNFSLITLWDVFEHIKDGVELLNTAKRFLKKGGGVFIQSPSRDALAARVLRRECNMFDGLEHVNLYNYATLLILAEKSGYSIESYETVISEIGVMNNYLAYKDPYLGSENLSRTVLNMDEDMIHKNFLGYKFQACLKMQE